MKKLIMTIFVLSAFLTSCQMEELSHPIPEHGELYASIEDIPQTKTYKDESNNVLWSEGDRIAVFMNSTKLLKYQVGTDYVGKGFAGFDVLPSDNTGQETVTPLAHTLAYYPYDSSVICCQSGKNYILDVSFPSEQQYVVGSFADGTLPMAAISVNYNLNFKNVCGVMKLQLKGVQSVKSVEIKGHNGEKLSGVAAVSVYSDGSMPSVVMGGGASSSVKLNCGSGVQLDEFSATEFFIVLPPVLFSKGFTVTVTDVEGNEQIIETDKTNEVIRSSILVMPSVTLDAPISDDMRMIDYIDEYGINHGTGVRVDEVVWAPVNCGYHKDDFKYGKLYQWGRKYGQGYSGYLYDVDNYNVGMVYDAVRPTVMEGPVSLEVGQSEKNQKRYYEPKSPCSDWLSTSDGTLWNSGTDSAPLKSDYDPCPDGWRVPTRAEFQNLMTNRSSWTTGVFDQVGCWFSGSKAYSESGQRVFFPAAGYRDNSDALAYERGRYGHYWSSTPCTTTQGYDLYFGKNLIKVEYSSRANGFSLRCVQDNAVYIPVASVTLDMSSISVSMGESFHISATVMPADATRPAVTWHTDDFMIASVDESGKVTGVSPGTVAVTATAGDQTATCMVTVNALPGLKDYIDEYGVNHGKGIAIDGQVWASVNCGYHEKNFKYGKLYQWGRKYGQGYSGYLYYRGASTNDFYSDAIEYIITDEGPVSLSTGQSKTNEIYFYKGVFSSSVGLPGVNYGEYNDWLKSSEYDSGLWNSGTEESPVKTEYDPCPDGWRVPTSMELKKLINCISTESADAAGRLGYWFSGTQEYSTSLPRIFLPAAGCLYYSTGNSIERDWTGNYWSSRSYNDQTATCCYFGNNEAGAWGEFRANGYSVRCICDESDFVAVSSIKLDDTFLYMTAGETEQLSLIIIPSNATTQSAYWYSSDGTVATVDQSGIITAVNAGTATITALVGTLTASCTVEVKTPMMNESEDYVDEYGVNWGSGIKIGEIVWAPVNCGYHVTDYKYGKLYQWGRKYGQGYYGNLYIDDTVKSYGDARSPSIVWGPVGSATGNDATNANVFYKASATYNYNWCDPQDDGLWNSGTETEPVKTENDPCPKGWRVPTVKELKYLYQNKSSFTVDEAGQRGIWLSGEESFSENASVVFFPAAGLRYGDDAYATERGRQGEYWSSQSGSILSISDAYCGMASTYSLACGYSVRCVQE